MLRLVRRELWVLALMVTACGLPPADAVALGELGNGQFRYHCTGANDVVCNDGLSQGSFPACILRGSSFGIDFDASDSEFSGAQVESASQQYFSGGSFQLAAQRVGRAAVVADADGRVIDMIHFEIVEPTGIGVWLHGSAPPSPLPLPVGAAQTLDVIPGAPCGPLGGSTWIEAESSDPSIATATWGDGGLEIVGHAEGSVVVTLSLGELATTVDVLVVPAPDEPDPPRRTTPEPDTDTDTDTDAGSGTGVRTTPDTDTDTDSATDTDGSTGG